MFEDYKLKKQIRNIQKDLYVDEDKFLNTLRMELEKYSEDNPVREEMSKAGNGWIGDLKEALNEKMRNFPFGNLRTNPKFARVVVYSFVFVLLSGGIAMASEQSLPGDSLYSIKLLTEDIHYSVSFSADSKAKLHASFASRRVLEIKTLLERQGVRPKGLDQAISRLQYNASSAAEALKGQKDGSSTSELAKNINDTFNDQKQELRETFKKEEEHLRDHEQEIKEKIREAKKSGNGDGLESLTVQLEGVKSERMVVVSKRNETFEAIRDEREQIKSQMLETERIEEDKNEMSEDIAELLNEEVEYLDRASREGLDESGRKTFELFNMFIGKAQDALQRGEYADAKTFLASAKIEFEKAINAVDDMMEEIGDDEQRATNSENNDDDQKDSLEVEKEGVSASATFELRENN